MFTCRKHGTWCILFRTLRQCFEYIGLFCLIFHILRSHIRRPLKIHVQLSRIFCLVADHQLLFSVIPETEKAGLFLLYVRDALSTMLAASKSKVEISTMV